MGKNLFIHFNVLLLTLRIFIKILKYEIESYWYICAEKMFLSCIAD